MAEKLTLFRALSTTGRIYSAIRITNAILPPERPEQEKGGTNAPAAQDPAEDRFWGLRERQSDLTAKEQRELRQLYQRFGTHPERYARSGVTLHIGP